MSDINMGAATSAQKTDLAELYKRFRDAYHELREAWIATGGGMQMDIKIRDAAAETKYQHRCAAAKKGGAKRRSRRG